MQMTDPSDARDSFQQALIDGEIHLERGQNDHELFVHLDHPNGQPRFTYVRLERQTVTALVTHHSETTVRGSYPSERQNVVISAPCCATSACMSK
jgi:hypothetical protein